MGWREATLTDRVNKGANGLRCKATGALADATLDAADLATASLLRLTHANADLCEEMAWMQGQLLELESLKQHQHDEIEALRVQLKADCPSQACDCAKCRPDT